MKYVAKKIPTSVTKLQTWKKKTPLRKLPTHMHTKTKVSAAQGKNKPPTREREIQQKSLRVFNKKHISNEVIYNCKV